MSIGGSEEGDGRSREKSFDGRHDLVLCFDVSFLTK